MLHEVLTPTSEGRSADLTHWGVAFCEGWYGLVFFQLLPVLWWNLPMLSICHHYIECCNFHSGNCSWSLKMMPTRNWCSPFQMKGWFGVFFFFNLNGCRHVTSHFRPSWASRPSKPTFRGCNGSTMKTKSPLAPETPDTSAAPGENRRVPRRFGCLGIRPEAFEALGEPKVTQLKSDEHWVIGFCHFYCTVLIVCNYV